MTLSLWGRKQSGNQGTVMFVVAFLDMVKEAELRGVLWLVDRHGKNSEAHVENWKGQKQGSSGCPPGRVRRIVKHMVSTNRREPDFLVLGVRHSSCDTRKLRMLHESSGEVFGKAVQNVGARVVVPYKTGA